ncbi:hypothetical protein LOTGIDRAFT_230332 [Lottia gigantea]|uniref:C2H2-type domain-containing protein n=1 Tax=Lottia gigantea TaxID=225164 RepID=V4CKK8_LOTGI|nr:hypothetical protein LOTGIDRAFT_230332 [Lottia gigantea]ESP02790.1 hypothetical protein LOTGIDRAFT_230332 [Lottia gigantea]
MDFKIKRSKTKSSQNVRKAKENPASQKSDISCTSETSDLDHEKESDSENVTGRFVCDECKKVLFSTKAVTIHKEKYHKIKKKSSDGSIIKHCEFCKQKICLTPTKENRLIDDIVCLRCRTSLYKPAVEDSTEPVKNDDEKTGLECVDCGRWFDSKNGVTMHMRMHEQKNDIVRYVCDICNYECVILSDDFLNHFQTHGDKPRKGKDLKCGYCNKTFSKVNKYEKHVKSHSEYVASDKMILKCCKPFCNAMFRKKDWFEKHQYMHQYLNYECSVCHKYFKTAKGHGRHFKICGTTKI